MDKVNAGILIRQLALASTKRINREIIDGEKAIVSELFVHC